MLVIDSKTTFNNYCSTAKAFEKEKDIGQAIKYYRKALNFTADMKVKDQYRLKIYAKIRKLHNSFKLNANWIETNGMILGSYFRSYEKTIHVCKKLFGKEHKTVLKLYLDMGSRCYALSKTTKYKHTCYEAAIAYYGMVTFAEPLKKNEQMRKEASDAIKKIGVKSRIVPSTARQVQSDEETAPTLHSSSSNH